jgi:hypothetical protein
MKPEMIINGPIPGNSLTKEPGNSPWEQPPKHVDLAEVVDYYSNKLVTKASLKQIKESADAGVPLTSIADVMLKYGVMKGVHSIDVGFIAFPIVVELLKTVAEISGASRIVVDDEEEMQVDEKTFMEVMNESRAKVAEEVTPVVEKGLMAKGEK